MSNRQKKKYIQSEVARLRKMPGWNPHNRVSTDPLEQLRALDQETQTEHTYAEATDCQECLAIRAQTNDQSALCDVHLEQALGFS